VCSCISQLVHYSRVCVQYSDCLDGAQLLMQKLFKQGFSAKSVSITQSLLITYICGTKTNKVLLDLQFYMYVLCIVVCPFVLFLLAIVLSVLRFTDSDYPFGICNLLFELIFQNPSSLSFNIKVHV
jgi:hypothetical protein